VNTEYEACDTASDKACAGVAHVNYVYEIASSKNMAAKGWFLLAYKQKPEPACTDAVRCW